MLTTAKLKENTRTTPLDWSGAPMREEDYYGGRPEHNAPPPEAITNEPSTPRKRRRRKRFSAQALANLRASMARTRAIRDAKRAQAKANAPSE